MIPIYISEEKQNVDFDADDAGSVDVRSGKPICHSKQSPTPNPIRHDTEQRIRIPPHNQDRALYATDHSRRQPRNHATTQTHTTPPRS